MLYQHPATTSPMPSMPLVTRRPSPRWIALALVLALACAKGASRPDAPRNVLHYPAWIATFENQLLVVNLNQDLAYDNGALVSIDATPGATSARPVEDGISVPNMAGQLLVVDADRAGACAANLDHDIYPVPFALVAARFESALYVVPLTPGSSALATKTKIDLNPFSANEPFGVGFSCSPDGTPRAWVGFMAGRRHTGYVTRVDLRKGQGEPDRIVEINVGKGQPRSFAYDAARDRLYFTTREVSQSAPVRWIQVGSGCPAAAADSDGVQDERKGGCHVDPGFDVSLQFRGAEPNDIALSSAEFPCSTGPAGSTCRRAYLSVRMYDADLAAFLGSRPSTDIGGKLMVVELPEGDLAAPEAHVVADVDIGMMAGPLRTLARPGENDLVAVTAIDDGLLWLYDDEVGAMVNAFGRDAMGVPRLGVQPTGIASQDLGGGIVRLFVTSYKNNWVSAVDVDLADPGGPDTKIVMDELTGFPWRLGVAP